jgi:glutamate-5-semialdehyde dehydrogenase
MNMTYVSALCQSTKQASYGLLTLTTEQKNQVLLHIASLLERFTDNICAANAMDLSQALENGITEVMLDRLKLTPERIKAIADSVRDLVALEDPVGKVLSVDIRPNGIHISKTAVPFGVVGMIYESRPNVTVDAACIALKTNNAIVLKGGKEAIHSNRQLVSVMKNALSDCDIHPDAIGFVDAVDREATLELLRMKGLIDVLIPRGGAQLIKWVCQNAEVPVMETGAGNCHLYVDDTANFDMALNILANAKLQRPSVCNAVEKVLVHQSIASAFIPRLAERFLRKAELRVNQRSQVYLPTAAIMTPQEYDEEYLDYILGVLIVDDVKEAVSWINQHGTHHSDGILSEDPEAVQYFITVVDSAVVYHNASTRFTDGGEFGFGAEIGIATSKLHARGPMGLEAMTTYKYIVKGQGQIR